jgi:hypothetical protein
METLKQQSPLSGCVITAVVLSSVNTTLSIPKSVLSTIDAGWCLDIIYNIGVPVAIALRIWWIGRGLEHRNQAHLSVILTIVESGFLFAAVTFVCWILVLTDSIFTYFALQILVQVGVSLFATPVIRIF